MSKLIVGCGYLGQRVAAQWADAGQLVHTVTRDSARAAEFKEKGWQPLQFDVTDPNSIPPLPKVDTILFAVGYGRAKPGEEGSNRPSIYDVYVDGLKNVLAAVSSDIRRFIYISSTGVYSQTDGSVVDEDSPTEPTREGGKACLAAEDLLQAHPLGSKAVILRLAGIYGPNRIPRKADLLEGKPIASPDAGFLNLIHVDDAVAAVLAAEEAEDINLPRTYLVSDGEPIPRGDYYREAARLLNAPPPSFAQPAADSHAATRAIADKRIDNSRIQKELDPLFMYPSYREGLAEILGDSTSES